MILVTGGTGFLGRRLVAQLLAKRQRAAVYARREDAALRKMGARFAQGDVLNKGALHAAFRKHRPAVVYHLAALINEADPLLYATNVLGTKNVVEMCERYKAKQLVHMSSSAALGETTIATESSPYNPRTVYDRSKKDSELVVKQSTVPYTIIRAPVILGPSPTWLAVFRAAQRGYPLIGPGTNHFHIAYVDDVVRLLMLVKGNKRALEGTFHVATKDAPTYEEFYRMLCAALGVPMTTKRMPVWAARAYLRMKRLSLRLRGRAVDVALLDSTLNRLIRDRVMAYERTEKTLGFSPRYRTREALAATVRDFKAHRHI